MESVSGSDAGPDARSDAGSVPGCVARSGAGSDAGSEGGLLWGPMRGLLRGPLQVASVAGPMLSPMRSPTNAGYVIIAGCVVGRVQAACKGKRRWVSEWRGWVERSGRGRVLSADASIKWGGPLWTCKPQTAGKGHFHFQHLIFAPALP